MSLHQIIPGSSLSAEDIEIVEEPIYTESRNPLHVEVRPDAWRQLQDLAANTGFNAQFLKQVAMSALLDRLEDDGAVYLKPRNPIERRAS